MIEKINSNSTQETLTKANPSTNDGFAKVIDDMRESKNKAIKGFINNKGLYVGIILVFIVILVFTTNINFNSTTEIIELSLVIFVFIFCTYSMYVNCADSGTKAGKNTSLYIDTKNKYDEIKNRIISQNNQIKLGEFCRLYVEEELKNTRKDILDSVGICYDEYQNKWIGRDKEEIKACDYLSNREKNAIIVANFVKPVKLVPEMILKCERVHKRRSPLSVNPRVKKTVRYSGRLAFTISMSLFTCTIALETISNPSWATFAELFFKLSMVILSGFVGFKMGYENITIDTVDYMLDQIDLLNQFEVYLSNN